MGETRSPGRGPKDGRVLIRFEAARPGHEEDLQELHGWFADDLALRGHVGLERVAADAPGHMGPGLEAVLAVISTGVGVAQLPLSYLAWRQSRRARRPVFDIHIVGADPAVAEELLRRLRDEALRDGDTGGDGNTGRDGGTEEDGDAGGAGDTGGNGT